MAIEVVAQMLRYVRFIPANADVGIERDIVFQNSEFVLPLRLYTHKFCFLLSSFWGRKNQKRH
jgi:hypothetical protein